MDGKSAQEVVQLVVVRVKLCQLTARINDRASTGSRTVGGWLPCGRVLYIGERCFPA